MKVHRQRGYSVLERSETTMMKIADAQDPLPADDGRRHPGGHRDGRPSLVYILASGTLPPFAVVHRMIGGIDSFPLLAVPFFILAGNLMNNAGITNRIYNFALALVGLAEGRPGPRQRAGLGDLRRHERHGDRRRRGLGTIEIKAMKDHGYATEFAVGVTAASATLGPIIPPSLPFVIYG